MTAENEKKNPRMEKRIDPRMEKRIEGMRALLSVIRQQEEAIRLGGGAKAIQSQHDKGRLTVRERLNLLLDPDTKFYELGLFAAFEMYGEWGGRSGSGRGDGAGAGERAAVHDHRERCDGEGGLVLSDDGEEGAAGADDCAGEPDSDAVPGGLGGNFSAAAGGCVS